MRLLVRSTFGLAALVSAALSLATLVIGVAAYGVTHEALEAQLDRRVETEIKSLLAEPGADRAAALADAIRRREAAAGPDHLGYILVDAAGRRIAGSLDAAAPARPGYEEFLHHSDGRVAQAVTTAVPGGGRMVVAADRDDLQRTDRDLLVLFVASFGGLLALGILGAWTLGTVVRARLTRIDRAAQAIIDGDLSRRMELDGSGSEFDRVSATLNRMLDRIGALLENLRQVSSDVAHDLRTPLTRLRNRLEAAQVATEEGDRLAAVPAAIVQADEILAMFASLLRISEVESMEVRRQFRDVALDEVLRELIETYRPDMEAAAHTLGADIQEGVRVRGDRRLLQQLASNLLDNALRHTPPLTNVQVELRAEAGEAVLTVSDDGPGVPCEDRDRLFRRFARSERSRSTPGHGLGLALVAAIAQAHGGTASLLPVPGLRVQMRFPSPGFPT